VSCYGTPSRWDLSEMDVKHNVLEEKEISCSTLKIKLRKF